MSSIRIPLDDLADEGSIEFRTRLAGAMFRMRIAYNERDDRYYLDIYDDDDVVIGLSIAMVLDAPLLARSVKVTRPRGELFCVDVGGGQPRRNVLGNGVDLVFTPWEDIT